MKYLRVLNDAYCILKDDVNKNIPEWVLKSDFYNITRTDRELSIVCPANVIPDKLRCNLPLFDFDGVIALNSQILLRY